MSVVASRTPVLLDLANVITLRQGLGIEVASGFEPHLAALPPWFDGNGIHSTVILRIQCTDLVGACELSLKMWSDPTMVDLTFIWEQPEPLKVGHSAYVLNTRDLFSVGPGDSGEKHIGIAHTLSGENARVDFSAQLIKAIPAR